MSATVKGQLPDGLEFNGKVHQEYELRQLTLGDLAAINDDEQAKANDYHRAAAAFECSLVKLGDIPRKEITRALLMGLSELDVEELTSARGRLQRRGPEQP